MSEPEQKFGGQQITSYHVKQHPVVVAPIKQAKMVRPAFSLVLMLMSMFEYAKWHKARLLEIEKDIGNSTVNIQGGAELQAEGDKGTIQKGCSNGRSGDKLWHPRATATWQCFDRTSDIAET